MSNRIFYPVAITVVLTLAILAWKAAIVRCIADQIATAPPALDGWKLVWHDEFDGKTVDDSKWQFEVNARGGGNNELQYYTSRPQNASVTNGFLVIQALRETFTGSGGTREFTSARLNTRNRGDWRCGRFDIRAKLPMGKGIWPAIWMLPSDRKYGGWPNGGEIDIMELVGHEPSRVHGTLHYGDDAKGHVYRGDSITLPSGNFSEEFHVFRLDWDPEEIRWYVDDKLYQTQKSWHTRGHPFPAPFDQRFHLILNLAVGGNWPGNPDKTTVFPQQLLIDYVRVYERIPVR
jgi:beta-glucanase (GH16 family)